jgi:hypothetical protein
MTIGTQTALRGVATRLTGRQASRVEAVTVAFGAAFVTYRFLRSGSNGDDESAET